MIIISPNPRDWLAVLWAEYRRPVALALCVAAAVGICVAAVAMGWVK